MFKITFKYFLTVLTITLLSKPTIALTGKDISEIVSENAIEVYIARIRKKLEGGDAKIETARGIGYKLTKWTQLKNIVFL